MFAWPLNGWPWPNCLESRAPVGRPGFISHARVNNIGYLGQRFAMPQPPFLKVFNRTLYSYLSSSKFGWLIPQQVILSVAKDLDCPRRFFATLRMTMPGLDGIWNY